MLLSGRLPSSIPLDDHYGTVPQHPACVTSDGAGRLFHRAVWLSYPPSVGLLIGKAGNLRTLARSASSSACPSNLLLCGTSLVVARKARVHSGTVYSKIAGNPPYPLELFQRVITVSLETMKIVNGLPALDIFQPPATSHQPTDAVARHQVGLRADQPHCPKLNISVISEIYHLKSDLIGVEVLTIS